MKNLLKLFGLSIVLSIAGLNALETPSEKIYINSEDIAFEDGTIYSHLENSASKPIPSEKIYINSEDITFENGTIYLHLENSASKPITTIYSDEKGIYVLNNQDNLLDQSMEPEVMCSQDNQDASDQPAEQEFLYAQDDQGALDQAIKEETLCANAYRKLVADYECSNCSYINPRYRKTCQDCGVTIIQ